ncbi:MAG TPA: CPBP family glutamic-type intramembrane protease [Dyella sp.]|uniref:type II CAAX prenyl endopeptidase Rce1 family protein n=1 Tax=Dyella sp. TaxID=1869338 RepID=UPI002F93461E
MPQLLRRTAWTASFVLAVAVLFWAMAALAAWMTRIELREQAQQRLAALHAGLPLWSWSPRQPNDLIAGHAFGKAHLLTGIEGVDSVSGNGSAFELGLPLGQSIDLRHWPVLRIRAKSSSPGQLGLSWETAAPARCQIADAASLSPVATDIVIDLRQLQAQNAGTAPADCSLPQAATALRLRPTIPAGASWLLKEVAVIAVPPVAPPSQTSLVLGGDSVDARRHYDRWMSDAAVPLVRLPMTVPAEDLLALRDRILARQPGAVLAPDSTPLIPHLRTALPPWLGWALCALYLAWLLVAAQYRAPEWIALLLILLGPLWLIVGLQWQLRPSVPALTSFLGALAFAAWREWQRPGGVVAWHWFGQGFRSWLLPLALVAVAYGLVIAFGHGRLKPLPWRHVLLYLAWASLQQWLILVAVMGRWERWRWPAAVCVAAAATVFALLHTPNGLLMQLCLAAELYWAWCFIHTRSLAPIALAHAAAALIVEAGLTGPLLRSLEISGRFFL